MIARPRLNAYVLAGDPAWVELSVSSYYDLVDRIVVSYDQNDIAWTGAPLATRPALERLQSVDHDAKVVLAPGDWSAPDSNPAVCETRQRQAALDLASEGADWVLQLDTDEVMTRPEIFIGALSEADARGFAALDFPMRHLYQHVRGDLYLERSRHNWGIAANYPGPLAVRAGTRLTHCRQVSSPIFRVDFRAFNTDPSRSRDAPVHLTVRPGEAVMHYSWVRADQEMADKLRSWGHAKDKDWTAATRAWRTSRRRPLRAVAATPLARSQDSTPLRLTRVPNAPGRSQRAANGLPG